MVFINGDYRDYRDTNYDDDYVGLTKPGAGLYFCASRVGTAASRSPGHPWKQHLLNYWNLLI